MPDIFGWPVAAAHFLVTALASLLSPTLAGLSTAVAIVLFTVAVRLLLLPLSRAAIRGEKSRAAVAPQTQQLYRKHRNDPEKLQRELTALHRESGTSMFAGFLPLLAQMPFFMVMYRLFTLPTVDGRANDLLTHTLFGTPLGNHLTSSGFGPESLVFVALFGALAVVGWLSMRWQAQLMPASAEQSGLLPRVLRLLPFTTIVVAAFLPLAAGLYLLTTTAWTYGERAIMRRPAPVADKVVAPTKS
jgi:YidC/Oxa1 family membrane protein insertase